MTERNEAFDTCIKLAKDEFSLKTLEYSNSDRNWKIESALFIGDSRIGAKRRQINQAERQRIIDKIQDAISDTLHISFENFSEFFNTE